MLAKEEEEARDGLGVWDQQMPAITYKMDEQQGPPEEHRELYSTSCNKPEWKRIFKRMYIYVYK